MFPLSGPRRPCRTIASLVLGLLFLGGSSGCGNNTEDDRPEVEVRGKLVFPGDTQSNLILTFALQDDKKQRTYRTTCLIDRHFKLKCPSGIYKITLAYVPAHSGASGPAATEKPIKIGSIPSRYLNPQDSPWKIFIPKGGNDNLVLKVE
jgi:hypothetical protein